MIRKHDNGSYYCDGHECGYPLMWCDGDPEMGDPPAVVCLDCNASMFAERPNPQSDIKPG